MGLIGSLRWVPAFAGTNGERCASVDTDGDRYFF